MLNKLPRILIISETFKSNTGGGITLSNLFKDYPKNCLANAIDAKELTKINSDEICYNFYSFGSDEKKVIKLFSFLQKKCFSGKYVYRSQEKKELHSKFMFRSFREILVSYFFLFLHFIGIYHILYRYEISDGFKKWVEEFKPDLIYTQLSSRELIVFTGILINLTGAKLAIHMMDDWPITISKKGLFENYWHRKIDSEFRHLLNKADVLMSISEAMTNEYKERYGKEFIPFHNPIEVEKWIPYSKKNHSIEGTFKILYTGRIGTANGKAIIQIAKAVNSLKLEGLNLKLEIFSPDYNSQKANKLRLLYNTEVKLPIPYAQIPLVLPKYNLLVLPLDFDKKGIRFAKLSIPTKASEYMISGTPILVFADEQMALTKYALDKKWAYVVSHNTIESLANGIRNIYNNINLREQLSNTAIKIATRNENAEFVRSGFISNLTKHFNN